MSSVKQETLSGVKWNAIERFSVQGVQFLLGLIMARLLTPEDFGAIAMLGIFIAISNTFIDSGFGNALIRKIDRTEIDYSTVFYFNIVVSIVCYILLFLLAPWVSRFYNMPILCPVLRVQSVTLILHSLYAIHNTRLTINIDFKGLARINLIAAIISGLAGVAMAYFGFGIWSLVYQIVLASIVNIILLWSYSKWMPSLSFSWKSFREMFSYGSKLLAAGLLNTVVANLNSLVIGKYFSANDLGYYNRGTNFARFPSNNISGMLQKVTFPILAKIQNEDEHLIRVYRKNIQITCMCIFFSCMLLAALAKPTILIILSDKWAESIIYLQIYCFSAMFGHINTINLNLLQVKGRSDLFLKLEILKKTISIIVLFASIPFGVVGICISKIIYTQIAIIINTYYTGKLFHLGYIEQIKDFSGFFFCSLIACLPAYLFTYIDMPHMLTLCLGLLTAPLLYWVILRSNENMKEIVTLIKAKVPFFKTKI